MRLEPTCPQQLGEVGDRDPVRGPSPLDLGRILEACERGDLGERADVVAALDLADCGDNGRRPDAVADAKPRQAVELRERSQGEHVVTGANEIRDRVEAVGRIEYQFNVPEGRQLVNQWGGRLKLLELGTRREYCDWSFTLPEQRLDAIEILLPDTQSMRAWAH